MQFDIREFSLQVRPFSLRLLDAVFAEDALSGFDDRADDGGIERLGDGHQRHRAAFASRRALGSGDLRRDPVQLFDGIAHEPNTPFSRLCGAHMVDGFAKPC